MTPWTLLTMCHFYNYLQSMAVTADRRSLIQKHSRYRLSEVEYETYGISTNI